jgi:hypothetical protein
VPRRWRINNVNVGAFSDWVATGLSDHVPLIVDTDIAAAAQPGRSAPRRARSARAEASSIERAQTRAEPVRLLARR